VRDIKRNPLVQWTNKASQLVYAKKCNRICEDVFSCIMQ